MKRTLRQRLIDWLKANPHWHASGNLQRIVSEKTNYTPQTTGRLLRELVTEGVIQVEYRKNHAWYRYNTGYIPPEEMSKKSVQWFDSLPSK